MNNFIQSKITIFVISAVMTGSAVADSFDVTYEAPGVQNSTAGFSYSAVETFDTKSVGNNQTFTDTFNTSGYTFTMGYVGVDIRAPLQYGGAGGDTNFGSTTTTQGYTVNLTATNNNTSSSAPITYFGFWLSALDIGNDVTFFNGSTEVYSFTPADVLKLVGNCPSATNPYCGNPNSAFLGQDSGEPFVFLNFYDKTGTFNKIVFSENPANGGGYESDNQTIGYFTSEGGTKVGVPEPTSIALLASGLLGFGVSRRKIN